MMDFDQAFEKLIGFEGGYVNNPRDPGGATKYGITQRTAKKHGYYGSMMVLKKEFAKDIYRAEYWEKLRLDELPDLLRYPLFDAAVNSGPRQAVKWLQKSVGAPADGTIGPVTMRKVDSAKESYSVIVKMIGLRLDYLTRLRTWPTFGRGWAKRIAAILVDV